MSPHLLKQQILDTGAVAVGFAPLREVEPEVMQRYTDWLAGGGHASMGYLADHLEIRRNPSLLLASGADPRPGGTIISIAYPYHHHPNFTTGRMRIARYALGDDYHEVLRRRLRPVAEAITADTGEEARICVDTAPILERYWATRAGLGFIGRNHQLIIPGHGSHLFLAEIVTRAIYPPDTPSTGSCPEGCDRCLRACPGNALPLTDAPGEFHSGRCHSYLTIEHRGETPEWFHPLPTRIYGCDICLEACPLSPPTLPTRCLPEFEPRAPLLSLSREDVMSLTPETFATLFRHSPVKRAKLAGLLRNARLLPTK